MTSVRNNARPHLGKDVRELLDRYSWEVLPHPPYSPDMSPPDFDVFPKLKINMRGVRFSTPEGLTAPIHQYYPIISQMFWQPTDLVISTSFQIFHQQNSSTPIKCLLRNPWQRMLTLKRSPTSGDFKYYSFTSHTSASSGFPAYPQQN